MLFAVIDRTDESQVAFVSIYGRCVIACILCQYSTWRDSSKLFLSLVVLLLVISHTGTSLLRSRAYPYRCSLRDIRTLFHWENLTSLPVCRETRRAEENPGYFDFESHMWYIPCDNFFCRYKFSTPRLLTSTKTTSFQKITFALLRLSLFCTEPLAMANYDFNITGPILSL